MKILSQLPVRLPSEEPVYGKLCELMQANYDLVKRKDTQIVVKDTPTGFVKGEWISYSGLRFINERQILKSVLTAEDEGFDGISVACFFDPAVKAAKGLLKIPVIGIGHPSFLLAGMMGHKFAVITLEPSYIPPIEESLNIYGVRSQAIDRNPVRSLTLPPPEFFNCLLSGDYTAAIDNFKKVAEGCIEEAADVLVVGCGLLSPMLTKSGITEFRNAAIIDPLLASLKFTEALVDLHKANIPIISRKLFFQTPSSGDIREAIAFLR